MMNKPEVCKQLPIARHPGYSSRHRYSRHRRYTKTSHDSRGGGVTEKPETITTEDIIYGSQNLEGKSRSDNNLRGEGS